MFGRIGIGELLLILAIALVIFGPAKLPELGKVLGDAIRNFRKSSERPDDLPGQPPAPGVKTSGEMSAEKGKEGAGN